MVSPQSTGARAVRGRGARAFTLIEVLVALIIFGVITVALSFTFDTAATTQRANIRRLEELGAVRSVFDYLTRDVQLAYASSNSTSSVFIAGSTQSGPQASTSGGLLTLMTRGNRIISDTATNGATGAQTGPGAASTSPPQSETVMVRYDFDPSSRTLSRTVLPVPSLQGIQQAQTDPQTVVAGNIQDISLRFWDPTALSWRSDWDYEQQNQQSSTASGATGTGAGTTAGAASSATATATTATGDTTLPGSVEVTVTVRHQDSSTATYVVTIPLVTSQVVDGMAPPTNQTTSASSSSGTAKSGP